MLSCEHERMVARLNRRVAEHDRRSGDRIHVRVDRDRHTITVYEAAGGTLTYSPTRTADAFHAADDRVRVVRGHVGSGKTTMMCAEIVFRACAMPPCRDGIRRSRWAVVRNTYGDLIKTTLHTWDQWFGGLGESKKIQSPSFSITHRFNDGDGAVELELLPIALDSCADVTKHLKSLEVTGVFLNELSELQRMVLDFFSGGRLPRFPRKIDFCDEIQNRSRMYWSGIIADTNPPTEDSWIYRIFEADRPPGYRIFAQPPAVIRVGDTYAVNPEAENLDNIPNGRDEYLNMTYGHDENFIRVYLMGEYGTLSDEKRVYAGYNDSIHSDEHLELDYSCPLIIGADLGTVAPVILIAQVQAGRLLILQEFCGEFTTIRELCADVVMPWLHAEAARQKIDVKRLRVEVALHDPADTYDGSEQLREFFGVVTRPARTNTIQARIDAVSIMLNRLIGGKAALCISRDGCVQLRKGFNGLYHYRRMRVIGEERYTDEPHKNHPYSDVHDALQYICLYACHEFDIKQEGEEYEPARFMRDGVSAITGY